MQHEFQAWLATDLAGNTMRQYLVALVVFLCVWGLLPFLKRLLIYELRHIDRTISGADLEFVAKLLQRIHGTVFPAIALYLASRPLQLHSKAERAITAVVTTIIIVQGISLLSFAARHFVGFLNFGSNKNDLAIASARRNLTVISQVAVWICGLLFLLSNLGVNISTLITGLGVGGIAVALAAQAILGDAFSSFTISLDKPFEIGDYVVIDSLKGTVERIGLKTTRIRSISGELLVFANSDLTRARIQNYQQIRSRRAVIKVSAAIETPTEVAQKIPGICQEIIHSQPDARFDRAHLTDFLGNTLNFEAVYFVDNPDYNHFMDVQQRVLLRIHQRLQELQVTPAPPAAVAIRHT